MIFRTQFTGELFGEIERVTNKQDFVERAGHLSIKQMVDAMRRSGQVLTQTRAGTYDFLTKEDLHKSSENFQNYVAALRKRDLTGDSPSEIYQSHYGGQLDEIQRLEKELAVVKASPVPTPPQKEVE